MSENTPNKTVELRIRVKAQNAILARWIDDCGGQQVAADKLGVSVATISSWLNHRTRLHASLGRASGGSLRNDKVRRIILILERDTGRNIRDIFALSKGEMRAIAEERVYEREIPRDALLTYAKRTSARLEYQPDVDCGELASAVSRVLEELSHRDRKVVEMRFGLNGHHPHTLAELSHKFNVGRERVRQLEQRAIKKLQQPNQASKLVGFLD